mmetsp:Transcript_8969/g.29639  ORF Transcript_8969/g.29639 Transcript_8969/m.29639 type:complete len:243 (-) Transcript_8969:88-816(-)
MYSPDSPGDAVGLPEAARNLAGHAVGSKRPGERRTRRGLGRACMMCASASSPEETPTMRMAALTPAECTALLRSATVGRRRSLLGSTTSTVDAVRDDKLLDLDMPPELFDFDKLRVSGNCGSSSGGSSSESLGGRVSKLSDRAALVLRPSARSAGGRAGGRSVGAPSAGSAKVSSTSSMSGACSSSSSSSQSILTSETALMHCISAGLRRAGGALCSARRRPFHSSHFPLARGPAGRPSARL